MGICASCLGLPRRDSHDAESTRLLDDDIYQSGYNYGAVNHGPRHGFDSEDMRKEREQLEAICQRTSDSVVDVWSTQQPYVSPVPPTAQRPGPPVPSRMGSSESAITQVLARTSASAKSPTQNHKEYNYPAQFPAHGELGPMKYVAYPNMRYAQVVDYSAAPKHWGEVVMSSRKGKKPRTGENLTNGDANGDDLFEVLVVQ
ncbi:hypothetical protein VTO42DRAFT_5384 [Malbranchea cinnamomea]